MPNCYRTQCNCQNPSVYSEFDTRAEALAHLRNDHKEELEVRPMAIVPIERGRCRHPRHKGAVGK